MAKVLREFEGFPREKEFVGSMLIAYAEIEFALFSLVASALDAQDNALQIFFRIRGEGARIEVSDAIVSPFLSKVELGSKWGNAIGPIRLCRRIRNQYAHCHWILVGDELRFVDFDGSVESTKSELLMRPTNLELLQQQFAYFVYSLDWLYYLNYEYELRIGKTTSHDRIEPKSIPAPPLYISPANAGAD